MVKWTRGGRLKKKYRLPTSPVLTSLCTSISHPMDDVKCCACRCKIGVIEEMLFLIETPRPQSIADGEYDCNRDQRGGE